MSASAVLGRESRESTEASGSLRLTRRGRIVFGGFATVLVAGLLALMAALAAPEAMAAAEGPNGEQFDYVVVQPGSSLWSLATDLDPTADPRDVITEIVQLNQLDGSSLQAGDAIAVPLRYSDHPRVVSGDELGA
ncbi:MULTISPECIES: LysM peptidoglycan-binding domain-containing protein [Leucobacter]|uniref:LysM domain-containing protein n=2 Tax=Leucobacter TaxID=55968 RepID=A0ABP5MZ08_9MICO|nr:MULTISPECIES: LysM peptidoglycan-binding domain-containing protein [Leucobacter]MBS3180800.1 LysM peptidoglycan-binding domain-containing protein [Leucobacter manosquensis]